MAFFEWFRSRFHGSVSNTPPTTTSAPPAVASPPARPAPGDTPNANRAPEILSIIWQGETVGVVENGRNDNGLLEGKFRASNSNKAHEFVIRAKAIDGRAAIRDYTKGARAQLVSSASETHQVWSIVILCLDGDDLGFIWPYDKAKIAWIEANVAE